MVHTERQWGSTFVAKSGVRSSHQFQCECACRVPAFAAFLHNLRCAAGMYSHPGAVLLSHRLISGLAPSHVRIKVGQEVFTDQDYANDAALLAEKSENFRPRSPRHCLHYGVDCLLTEDQGPEPQSWASRTLGADGVQHHEGH